METEEGNQPTRIAVDADCPRCGHPERWFDPQQDVFGCNKCTYTSNKGESPTRIAIDADCPRCGHPERWFDPQQDVFGCNKCTYTSNKREA